MTADHLAGHVVEVGLQHPGALALALADPHPRSTRTQHVGLGPGVHARAVPDGAERHLGRVGPFLHHRRQDGRPRGRGQLGLDGEDASGAPLSSSTVAGVGMGMRPCSHLTMPCPVGTDRQQRTRRD